MPMGVVRALVYSINLRGEVSNSAHNRQQVTTEEREPRAPARPSLINAGGSKALCTQGGVPSSKVLPSCGLHLSSYCLKVWPGKSKRPPSFHIQVLVQTTRFKDRIEKIQRIPVDGSCMPLALGS